MSAVPGLTTLPTTGRILCVDDEPGVLAALQRLFLRYEHRVVTATSAAAGIAVLEAEPIDIVISDMRMPEMGGAEFLEQVRLRWPATVRLLLTGYADVASIIGAINRGEIHRYVTKPWDDAEVVLIVRQALERQALEREKARLEALAQQQNETLRELNASLEQRVAQRTAELASAQHALLESNERLKSNFLTSIKILSSVLELRGGGMAGHARRVADLARRIAIKLGLTGREVQDVFVAGLLHEIGKTGFSDELLGLPVSLLKGDNLGLYRKYPQLGEELLMPLDELREAARVIRSHGERFDGAGFPDGLAGFDIPIGARILAVACDFEGLQRGLVIQGGVDAARATELIVQGRGRRYDPSVVDAFHGLRTGRQIVEQVAELVLPVAALRPGMVLSRDLVTVDGALLLSADHVLSDRLLAQLAEFERRSGQALQLHVRKGAVPCAAS
jgi:response regulator RpfG family c-di-GMP phosphodiesterase